LTKKEAPTGQGGRMRIPLFATNRKAISPVQVQDMGNE
jgi:hypothetical protein